MLGVGWMRVVQEGVSGRYGRVGAVERIEEWAERKSQSCLPLALAELRRSPPECCQTRYSWFFVGGDDALA